MLERKPHHKQLQRSTKPQKSKASLKPQGKNQLGILKRQWNAQWKKDFAHIRWCESCGVPDGFGDDKLTQMHAEKQRFITTEAQCRRAAWVCWREHYSYDFAVGDNVHQRMADFVDALVARRD